MPSCLPAFISGGQQLVSGNPWSGNRTPIGTIQFFNDPSSSGPVFVGMSGGVTMASGGALSSGGMLDGMPVYPGAAYELPKLGIGSGVPSVFLGVAAAVSGRVRLFWEAF